MKFKTNYKNKNENNKYTWIDMVKISYKARLIFFSKINKL